MCGVCGCSGDGAKIEGTREHEHVLSDGRIVRHSHHLEQGAGHAHDHADEGASRLIIVERDLLERNDAQARANRAHFAAHGLLVLNLVSSPGAGKTTLLTTTIASLEGTPLAVIEGDQQTAIDAERIRATGAPAIQINTGKGCHLDAAQVDRAFSRLHHLENGVLFIENVGNLVCPAAFDLGETHRVVIASVTEGEDKPLKYPDMFASADLMIVSKAEIADACGADIELLIANARKVRPGLPAIVLSARTGQGMERWLAWLSAARSMIQAST